MSSRIFFSSDTHFSHANIIRYCNRPFSSITEMDDAIIGNWNSIVRSDDVVYHLGDFCWGDPRDYVGRLNGKIFLIAGSHDKNCRNQANLFQRVFQNGSLDTVINNQAMTLSHCYYRVWEKSHYDAWNLYGHSHGTLPPIGKAWDVGVDNNNFMPLSFEQVEEIMSKREHNANYIPSEKRNH